jgi:hypothetical protein
MFWVGMIVGLFVGTFLGLFCGGLLVAAKQGDDCLPAALIKENTRFPLL